MLPEDIHTISDFIAYCREILAERPEYMSEKEQESPAAGIVGFFASKEHAQIEKEYPEVIEILDIASDLEISNVDNTTIHWRQIKRLVDRLERKVSDEIK